jgi:divalent metal cation (Fe/Co/Zn/Cd) transporter
MPPGHAGRRHLLSFKKQETTTAMGIDDRGKNYERAYLLALFTIFYNIAEGIVSIIFGFRDETISLFGFGLDSFVEVISGIGIWHMMKRLRENAGSDPDVFERQALRVTGTSFYLLTGGLTLTSLINLSTGHRPETTFWGIVVACVSIAFMWFLIHYKMKIGKKLNSHAILADASCSRSCLYLSVILLVSSATYELTGFAMIDSLGALGIALYSFREGREAFEKARGKCCSCSSCPVE